jgi:hypothetical protein
VLKSAVFNLYTTPAWTKAMFSVFVNYPLNNPSYKGEARKRQELEKLLDELVRRIYWDGSAF